MMVQLPITFFFRYEIEALIKIAVDTIACSMPNAVPEMEKFKEDCEAELKRRDENKKKYA